MTPFSFDYTAVNSSILAWIALYVESLRTVEQKDEAVIETLVG